jgi:hypothetical protein
MIRKSRKHAQKPAQDVTWACTACRENLCSVCLDTLRSVGLEDPLCHCSRTEHREQVSIGHNSKWPSKPDRGHTET